MAKPATSPLADALREAIATDADSAVRAWAKGFIVTNKPRAKAKRRRKAKVMAEVARYSDAM